jgi:hypothetical protein
MPFAICFSPNAAALKSEDAGCVVENKRTGARSGRDRAGAMLRRAVEEARGIILLKTIFAGSQWQALVESAMFGGAGVWYGSWSIKV